MCGIVTRFLHRHGYGIQSPWLFSLVTEVIPAREEYYAYASLPPVEGWSTKDLRLLLRLANHFQPHTILLQDLPSNIDQWLIAGCNKAHIECLHAGRATGESSDTTAPRIIMTRSDSSQCLITPKLRSSFWLQAANSPNTITLETRRLGLCYTGLNIPSQHFKI